MLNTYGKINYEVEVPLSLDYTKSTIHKAGGQYGSTPQYMYTRRATKTYRFKGMSESTAKACLNDKKIQYNRKFMGWKLLGGNWYNKYYFIQFGNPSAAAEDYHAQVATFNVVRNGAAPTFDVQITVNEIVTIYGVWDYNINTPSGIGSLERKFQAYDSSYISTYNYDENLT